jgi:hypothetical protein
VLENGKCPFKGTIMSEMKPVRITGNLYWTQWMTKINKAFNEDSIKYECTIGDLSDKDCEALKAMGIKIKNKDGQGNFIVCKSNYVHKAVDEDGLDIDPATIGKGTKVVAIMSFYTHKMSKQHGNAPSIKKLIITELVTYNPGKELSEELDEYVL